LERPARDDLERRHPWRPDLPDPGFCHRSNRLASLGTHCVTPGVFGVQPGDHVLGVLAEDRRGPVLPRDLLEPAARRVLAVLPAAATATVDDIALRASTTKDDAVARLYELRSLGYVERHDDGWKLTRQAMISVRSRGDRC
jgi:hypothetical protein